MTALIDTETTVLEQLDFEPPCQIDVLLHDFKDGCERAATLMWTCAGCGPVLTLCDFHAQEWLARADEADRTRPVKHWTCNRCKTSHKLLRKLFLIVPLPGGAS